MKAKYMITKEFSKYLKREIKSGRVRIANSCGYVYILTNCAGIRFPAMPAIWDAIARPVLGDMPADGAGVSYATGHCMPMPAIDVVNLFNSFMNDNTPAKRTPFSYETKEGYPLRLFKNSKGEITAIYELFDSFVDFGLATRISAADPRRPVIAENADFAAVLLPVILRGVFADDSRSTFGDLLDA